MQSVAALSCPYLLVATGMKMRWPSASPTTHAAGYTLNRIGQRRFWRRFDYQYYTDKHDKGRALGVDHHAAGTTFAPGRKSSRRDISSLQTSLSRVPRPSICDQPFARQLLDNQLNTLNATYSQRFVNITVAQLRRRCFPAYDGDRTSRLADWLQIGRTWRDFNFPTNGSEFQRADCAPRSTLGDGSIRATDWIKPDVTMRDWIF